MEDKRVALNAFAWLFNVSTSVVIVFVNKVLMGRSGYYFNFAVTLCALHFLACGTWLWALKLVGLMKHSTVDIPWKDRIVYTVAANVSIAALNLSLMINSVGFYQIAKLLIIPFTALVEALWLGEHLSPPQVASTVAVLCGVAIVTVSDVAASGAGIFIAAVSVASSAMQQILCRYYLKKHSLSSNDLLSATSPLQGWSLLFCGPVVDRLVGGSWVTQYELSVPALVCLAASCSTAVLVNISQFMCLGRFSAVTFQVTGHAKTVLVLIGSWAFMQEHMGVREVSGMSLAVAGMMAYGFFTSTGQGKAGGGGAKVVGLADGDRGGERRPLVSAATVPPPPPPR